MVSFVEGLASGLRSAYCSQVSGTPQWFSNLRSVLIPGDVRRSADNLNRWICDSPTDEISDPTLPFEGGQCPGTLYEVLGTYTASCFSNQTFDWRAVTRGPVEGVTFFLGDPVNGWAVKGRNSSGAVAYSNCVRVGASIGISVVPRPGVICTQAFPGGVGRDAAENAPTITSVTPLSGPDDCGDPPPAGPPVGPIEVDIDIDYDDGDGNPISITVPAIFAPVYVALDGTLRIPISIGEINFKGEINLDNNFEIAPNFEVDFGSQGQSDDPDLPDTDRPEDVPPIEPLGPDQTIIGVHVRATPSGNRRASAILQDNAPTITAPRCANVVFGIRIGSLFGWTSDIPVKNLQAYIHCPVPEGAHDVRVTAEPGYDVSMTPVRGKPANPPD